MRIIIMIGYRNRAWSMFNDSVYGLMHNYYRKQHSILSRMTLLLGRRRVSHPTIEMLQLQGLHFLCCFYCGNFGVEA